MMEPTSNNRMGANRTSETKFRDLINNFSGVIYSTDINGVIDFASAGVLNLTGYTPSEVAGRNFSFLVDPAFLHKVYQHYTNQLKDGTRETILEFYAITRDGQRKWVEQIAVLLEDPDGTKTGFQCFVRDISEKQAMQQALIAAREEAEDARKMQEQFLANMSHEIRTPMNGIQGMTQLLTETPLNHQQQEFVGVIGLSVENLLVIINDILDFSKIKAGKLSIEKIDFRPADVVANIHALFGDRLAKKGLGFETAIDPGIPEWLQGDPHRLSQVLINLVGNAIKFSEHGTIRIQTTLVETGPRSATVAFAVSDQGIGIRQENLPHIFDSFSQAGSDIARKYGGTGLGLAICKQLTALQEGAIDVRSEEGRGTTFRFQIPFGNRQPQRQPRAALQSIGNFNGFLRDLSILVVEDNPINQKVTEHVLNKAGAVVTIADNGELAIQQLNQKSFDLIIMDLQMPVMDGYETTRFLRDTLRLRTPVLAMTASAIKGEHLRCLEAGMDDYMSKPFEFKDFYHRVARLLDRPLDGPLERPLGHPSARSTSPPTTRSTNR
jgi:PAS domain S-box-containing protein